MKIHVPCISDQTIGGGYTFLRNFEKGVRKFLPDITLVPENEQHDILFAFSPTTVNGETIERSKKSGAKFVLRVDGVPEDPRNSGRGTRRLVEYARAADCVVYQSEFVRNTLGRILRENGVNCFTRLIYNGVDTDIFNKDGPKVNFKGSPNILHIAYRKDPNKRYEEVLAMYREYWTTNKKANLILMGRYPTEWMSYNMGFFNGERYQRVGIIEDEQTKAAMIRSCDVFFYPSFADPAPNVVLEAMACNVPIIYNHYGGVAEMVKGSGNLPIQTHLGYIDLIECAIGDRYPKVNYLLVQQKFTLKIMVENYRSLFDLTLNK